MEELEIDQIKSQDKDDSSNELEENVADNSDIKAQSSDMASPKLGEQVNIEIDTLSNADKLVDEAVETVESVNDVETLETNESESDKVVEALDKDDKTETLEDLEIDQVTLSESNEDDNNGDNLEILEIAEPKQAEPVRKLSEEELALLNAEIDALEETAKLDKATDKAPDIPKFLVVENTDDSQELADEVGVSNIYDEYGREILEPCFENRLRMSKNGVKLAYSKLKNTILSYKGIKQKFVEASETFKLNGKLLFVMEIGEGSVLFYANVDSETLDKEEFNHTKSTTHKETPTKLIVKKETGKETVSSLERALTLIEKVVTEANIAKYKVYVPVAYAERYPLNPTAVLRGKEGREPDEDAYKSDEYEPIEGEITMNIIAELMPSDHSIESKKGRARLDAMRQQATTIKGAVAMTEPIVYFYDTASNSDNTLAYINVQQVLNDKFMGKILPQQYFAVAESSERIVDLVLLTLKRVVEDCNQYPKILFVAKISARLLAKNTTFEKLLKAVATDNQNLILAFDSALLEALGDVGLNAMNKLKQNDIKIMIDGTENAGLKILTEYPISYLRFDARYYKETIKSTVSHLDMLTGYCKVQGIMTTAEYVDNTKTARFLQTHGVEQIQGPVVCEPKRMIYSAVKGTKKLPTFKR
jgi:EAL domain-containing protein (putative c-di-GMP-specific phosphodiesterase class I)